MKTMSSATQGQTSVIKSRQQFIVGVDNGNSTRTATITGVNTSKSFVIFNGSNANGTALGQANYLGSLDLTNTTTVTATRNDVSGQLNVAGTVVEYY